MALFNYTPSQFYSRTPATNLNSGYVATNNNYNPVGNGIVNGIAAALQYGTSLPGTTGYRLPAQNYYNYGINNIGTNGVQTLKNSLVNTAINSALQGVVYGLTGNSLDLSQNRLAGTGVAQGATSEQLLQAQNASSKTAYSDDSEDRVIIYDQTGELIAQSDIMAPLQSINGVLFPYTPQITFSHKASYEMLSLVHTNYTTPVYQHSSVDGIQVSGMFTANYPAEAEYIVAMLHFFRSATKMFYGQDQLAGTPPPVLFLDGYGPYTLDHIPVVVTGFDYTLPNEVDYISCSVSGYKQKVPTSLSVTLNLQPTYSRNKISNEFGLSDFASGALIQGGSGTRSGGWL